MAVIERTFDFDRTAKFIGDTLQHLVWVFNIIPDYTKSQVPQMMRYLAQLYGLPSDVSLHTVDLNVDLGGKDDGERIDLLSPIGYTFDLRGQIKTLPQVREVLHAKPSYRTNRDYLGGYPLLRYSAGHGCAFSVDVDFDPASNLYTIELTDPITEPSEIKFRKISRSEYDRELAVHQSVSALL